jgi:phosphoadenosine phosphosulfate reductase
MSAEARRQIALLHSRSSLFASQLIQAQRTVTLALETAGTWYVALSGGKDSTCILALTREQAPNILANHSQRQWMLPETREYLDSIPNIRRIAYAGRCETDWAESWDSREAAEAEGCIWLDSKEAISIRGAAEDGAFLGLRMAENGYRRIHLRTMGPLFQNKQSGKWQCNPIGHWSAIDVWAFIESRGIPYNKAYDRLASLGLDLEHQRIGPFAVEGALSYGMLAILKRGWPEVWNAFAARFPEARRYA